jgi:hypothetical protein
VIIWRGRTEIRKASTEFGLGDTLCRPCGDGQLVRRVVETRSLVLCQIGGAPAGEMAVHRLLDSPHVTPQEVLNTAAHRTAAACSGRRIVAAQDTTEIIFSGRSRRRKGLGPAGDGKTPGFFCHTMVVVDVEIEAAPRVARLSQLMGVSRRTLTRWREWRPTAFAESRFWRAKRAVLMPPVDRQRLPASLLKRFAGGGGEQLLALLRLLAPISGGAIGHAW